MVSVYQKTDEMYSRLDHKLLVGKRARAPRWRQLRKSSLMYRSQVEEGHPGPIAQRILEQNWSTPHSPGSYFMTNMPLFTLPEHGAQVWFLLVNTSFFQGLTPEIKHSAYAQTCTRSQPCTWVLAVPSVCTCNTNLCQCPATSAWAPNVNTV